MGGPQQSRQCFGPILLLTHTALGSVQYSAGKPRELLLDPSALRAAQVGKGDYSYYSRYEAKSGE